LRIIAGKFKSRRIAALRGKALRPTSDRLRETLFNILGAAVEGSLFVDLYAGTGAVGIEALSRGAQTVIFIEKHRAGVALIKKNLTALGIREGATVLACDALRGLAQLEAEWPGWQLPASFFFLDPPYAEAAAYESVLAHLEKSPFLTAASLVIAEHTRRVQLPERVGRLARTRLVEQGDAALSFYRLESSSHSQDGRARK
jgi:16S rRNA (guanine966-N2)-methyltransferase